MSSKAPTSKAPSSKAPSSKAPTSKAPSSKAPSSKAPTSNTQTLKNISINDIIPSRQQSIHKKTLKIQKAIKYKIFQSEAELQNACKTYKNSSYVKETYGLINNWKFSKNIKSMANLFSHQDLTDINISNWDVSNIKNMHKMFYFANGIHIDFSKWNVSNVTDMEFMFTNAYSMTNINFNNWNVSNCNSMQSMFYNCYNFNSNLNSWIVNPQTYMNGIFYGCKNFNVLKNCYNWYLSYGVTNIFKKSQLKKIDELRKSNILYLLDKKGIQLDANTVVEVINAIN